MENLYLKRITDKDEYLLIEYNKDLKNLGINIRINESNFKEWLEKIESTCYSCSCFSLFSYAR